MPDVKINMPVSRERMEQYQNRHIRQIEHAAKQWEAREMKVKNNMMRRQWLQRQTSANYRNEYDRIRGELSHYRIPYQTKVKLEKREEELKKLFSQGNV
jgi:hypothetical protein